MPPHRVYIEPFLGGGNVLANKLAAETTIGIDADLRSLCRFAAQHRGPKYYRSDALTFLSRYKFTGDELVYCDPPYLHSTRKDVNLYRHEYTDAQHRDLLSLLVTVGASVMVSGYSSPLYHEVLEARHGWRCVRFNSMTRQGLREECLWCNFPRVDHRHDARYVGANYRERERIKRKRDRWRARFEAMDAGERQVVFEALSGILPPAPASRARILSPSPAIGAGDAAVPAPMPSWHRGGQR